MGVCRYRSSSLPLSVALGFTLLAAGAIPAAQVSFGPKQAVTTSANLALSVVAADVDGDGDTDLVSGSFLDDKVAWHENVNGDGSVWMEHVITTTADAAFYVQAGDVDGDGDIDALSASSGDDTVAWYENTTGTGTAWTKHVITTNADSALSITLGDVDLDGDVDVLSASFFDDKIAWHENVNGDGSAWIERVISNSNDGANYAVAADVDRDGDIDVFTAHETDNKVAWFENVTGDGLVWTEHVVTTNAQGVLAVHAADVDRDGDLDAVSASSGSDEIAWYENTAGDGSAWTKRVITTNADFAAAAFVADLDRDGDFDVLSASGDDDKIAWHENYAGDGSEWEEHVISTTSDVARAVVAADCDGDGDLDVMSASQADSTVAWFENTTPQQAAPSFPVEQVLASGLGDPRALALGDLDNDGDEDILAALETSDSVVWFDNANGDGTSWIQRDVFAGLDAPQSIATFDVDVDGDTDVLVAYFFINTVVWFENATGDGLSWTAHVISNTVQGAQSLRAEDADGDGDNDVFVSARNSGHVFLFLNADGDGSTWTPLAVSAATPNVFSVFPADVDGDGDIDLMSAGGSTGSQFYWHENVNGDGLTWALHTIFVSGGFGTSIEAFDLDEDGDLDAVTTRGLSDRVEWHENVNGDGSLWTTHPIDLGITGVRWTASHDLDRDGDIDVAVSVSVLNQLLWYENLGNGVSWASHVVNPTAVGARGVFAGDLDRDGYPDLVSANQAGGTVSFYPARSFLARRSAVSLAAGGAQTMVLDAGDSNAFGLYWVLGAVSGTSPGQPIGALNLPLNLDNYFLYTVFHSNQLIQNQVSFLNADGVGAASMFLPPGLSPSLAGITFSHAYGLIDIFTFDVTFVSTPISLRTRL